MIREWTLDDFRAFFYLKVYRYLKTVIIMPIETRFKTKTNKFDFITVANDTKDIVITATTLDGNTHYILDIPTAIKLSKTIRTHINLVKSNQNGNR